jgi:hypothetical protein
MQVWIVCLVLFFGTAEFYQWAKGLALPLPVLIASGALLAIASNLRLTQLRAAASPAQPPLAVPATAIAASSSPVVVESVAASDRVFQRSISFTIHSPDAIVED